MFACSLRIQSSPDIIWNALTKPELMKKWMGEPEMMLEISTNWLIGNPIFITGFHHVRFQNYGIVLQYEPYRLLRYTSLSSVSRLADIPENHSEITFELRPMENETELIVSVNNFPTDTIRKHLEFYWRTAIHLLKQFVTQHQSQ